MSVLNSVTVRLGLLGLASLCLAADADDSKVDPLLEQGTAFILTTQEGEGSREWPYEGVYRVRGPNQNLVIPMGYRVGGTSITGMALVRSPAMRDDPQRNAALDRAIEFVCEATSDPLMSYKQYGGGYDVRGWGYIYAILFLRELQDRDVIPEPRQQQVQDAIEFYTRGLVAIEIPTWGGWNYSRRRSVDRPCPQAPFMTGPAIQALATAAAGGQQIDPAVIERGLDALERSRSVTGAVEYTGGDEQAGANTLVAGAVGRMLATESTLYMASRGSLDSVRGALDAFFAHWERLEERRARSGTHEGPFGVAPYYFFYAHLYAAQAIELLPKSVRMEYHDRLRQRLLVVRAEDGTWNDRVFPRSATYGTAMAILSLTMPEENRIPKWPIEPKTEAAP
ncbi:MAG: hypothetical protein P8K80_02940 [Phycisphaerales bacterium]|nr:hypothetical protein [Phycisphaerales bacterium]